MKFRFLSVILTLLAAFCMLFSLAACGEKTPDQIPTPPAEEDNSQPPVVTPSQSVDFEMLLRDYKDKVTKLYTDVFAPKIKAEKNVLSEIVAINANDSNKIDSFTVFYVDKVDEENRKITLTTAKISAPIAVEEIIGENYQSSAGVNVTDEVIFEFNAKQNIENTALCQALKTASGLNGDIIFREVESKYGNCREFEILTFENDTATLRDIMVIVDNKTDNNELLSKFSNANNFSSEILETYKLTQDKNSSVIYASEGYSLDNENFGTTIDPSTPGGEEEKPPVESDQIQSVEDLTTNYSNEVNAALNDALLASAGRSIYGRNFNAENLVETKWDLGNSDIISELKLISTYKQSSTSNIFNISTIKLETPVNVKNLQKDTLAEQIDSTIKIETTEKYYELVYKVNALNGHEDLTKAIFTACGHTLTEGSTILFVDGNVKSEGNGGIDFAHEFTVAEITDKGVQEYTIRVKEASTDQDYINNLINKDIPGNFYIQEQQSQTLSGNIVKEQAQENEVETTSYRYIVDFGDDERAEVLVY